MSSIAKYFFGAWEYAFNLVSREHVLSLTDQAVVSATGFLTTFLIARWSDSSQLGIFALALSLLLSLVGFQESLILQPYLIQRHYPDGTPTERAGASLILSVLFSVVSILALIVAAISFLGGHASPEIVIMTWAIAGIVPFALARDFARRFAFAHFNTGRVLLLDLAAAIIQLCALVWLGTSGRMSALSACAALGTASAFPTAIWFYYSRAQFKIRVDHLRKALKQTWALGKWLLVGRITGQAQGYIIYWIAMAVSGAAVTGVYAACMSIVGFANPLMIGLTNVLMPKSVLAWKDGGGPGLWHEAIRNGVLTAALMMVFSLAVFVGGEHVMNFLFHGKEFEGYGPTLTVLALATSLGTLGMPASIGLATMERPRAIVMVSTVEAILTVAVIWILMTKWSLLGAAYGLLAGNTAGTVGRWIAFFVRIPKFHDPKPLMRALQELTKCTDQSRWAVARIGAGGDGNVFVISSTDGQPIWRTYATLVAKLYKPEAALTFEMVQKQFNSLNKLHTALHGREVNGWRISVPHPLYVFKAPLALVMTAVPGKYIDSYGSKGELLSSKDRLDAARTFAMVMRQCWSSGQRHGDLNFRNVLFDIEAKKISLLDPGTDCLLCNDVAKLQSPVVADLGHVLWEIGIDVMDLFKSAATRMRKELFFESVLLSLIEEVDSAEEERRFLKEIWRCAQQHLAERLELPWSLQGVWNRFVKQLAIQRIRSILDRVNSYPNICTGESELSKFRAPGAVPPIS